MKAAILIAIVSVVIVVAVQCAPSTVDLSEDWRDYRTKFAKSYGEMENLVRRGIWEEALKKIQHHNLRASLGELTYTLGVNQFSDRTEAELAELLRGLRTSDTASKSSGTFMTSLNAQLPHTVDWRTKGYVTPVKDQTQPFTPAGCGSCWAFSATGALEGQVFRKTGKLISLSEQNLIDCSGPEGNGGCEGGWMTYAFQYVVDAKGIESEAEYPYVAQEGTCMYQASKAVAKDTGFVELPGRNEANLTAAVATVGPISVVIKVADSFFSYSGGVYNEPSCNTGGLHAVLVVGYGTDPKGEDYYIVKNCWGAWWGMKGYVLMSRNRNNQCGIANNGSYPLV